MAVMSPYMVAMDHAEWRGGKVKKNPYQKRALGRMEREIFIPAHPVLSLRTSDIDLSGTRTHRACSNDDIITQQHSLIRHVYNRARSLATVQPPKKPHITTPELNEQEFRPLSAIHVKGHRPQTAPVERTVPDETEENKTTKQPERTKRPKTAGNGKRVTPLTPKQLLTVDDDQVLNSAREFNKINSLVHDQWQEENHDISEQQFTRHSKSVTPSDKRISFSAGGQMASSTDLIDVFTSTKCEEYYTVDPTTGCQVAKQIRKGDKVRIGINGTVQPKSPPGSREKSRGDENIAVSQPSRVVPLCWDDQVSQATDVLGPTPPGKPTTILVMSQTEPVVFNKEDATESQKKKSRVKSSQGYKVKSTSRSRRGIDGRESVSSKITDLSISKDAAESEEDVDISYEAIVQMHATLSRNSSASRDAERAKAVHDDPVRSSSRIDIVPVPYEKKKDNATPKVPAFNVGIPGCLSRPTTPFQGNCQESDLERLVVQSRKGSDQSERTSSAKPAGRPPPAKPTLHKTAAAAGSSVQRKSSNAGSHKSDKELEYIQIAQHLSVSCDQNSEAASSTHSRPTSSTHGRPRSSQHSRPTSSKASRPTSSSHSRSTRLQAKLSENPVPPVKTMPTYPSDPAIAAPPPPVSPAASSSDITAPLQDLDEQAPGVHPSSEPRSPSPDVHYAFNIPTGQVADADANSAYEPTVR